MLRNPFILRISAAGLVFALGLPSAAAARPELVEGEALRPMGSESAGQEEELSRALAPDRAGLEEGKVQRWSNEESSALSLEMERELGLKLAVDLFNGAPETAYSEVAPGSGDRRKTAAHGRREWLAPGPYRPELIRVGPLLFLEEGRSKELSAGLRERLGANLILVRDLPESPLAADDYAPYTAATLAAMLENNLAGKAVIDAGAADGLLSIVALRLGAAGVELFEIEEDLLRRAEKNLRLNGYLPGRDFELKRADLTDTPAVLGLLRETDEETVLITNIGTWPVFTASNADSIRLLEGGRRIAMVIGGGHYGMEPWSGAPFRLPEDARGHLDELARLGFAWTGLADYPAGGESPQHFLAWVARRQAPAAGLEEPEVMPAAEFQSRYPGAKPALVDFRDATLEEMMGRADVQATVVNLPKYLYVYVQGGALFWSVQETLPNRSPKGSKFVIFEAPRQEWPGKVGLIFQYPMVERLTPEQNPLGLPVHGLRLEDVPGLDPFDVIAKIFRSRLKIPESKYLGGMVFRDGDSVKLVLFSA